ncbi:trophoblast glycoprotein [Chelydra serpentina]|uniref:Trophoblast glycoprotein n=1 Tax=Chelydra serpentina TaxID=8475 RepID=A0A8T1THH4_CHESE|nr:trophoblast glycoprotein [Chelydra serpentina]
MAGRALRGAAPPAPGGERRAALGLLLQVLLGWGSAQQPGSCPAPCECSEAARTVKCVNRNLTAVPPDLPPYTRLLFLTGNRLASLPPGAFLSLPQLSLLNLSGSHLQQVEAGAFASLPSLRQLDLSGNALARLSPEAFGNASSPLQELNLSNSLSNQSVVPALAELLGWGVLGNLSRLELADNRLISLPAGMFSSLPSLQHLDLRNNSLVSLQAVAFLSLPQLQSLDLSHNSLKCLKNATIAQFRSLPALRRISLGHNTWVCDCCIEHLVSWLKESDQVEGKGALKCSYPDKMQDKALVKTNSSDLDCSVPVDIQSQLQTSYVFLGIVLALIGAIFLLVLYLNRKGIKKWMYNIRDACRDHMEGYHYRYEMNADPRLTNLSSSSDV